MFSAILSLLLGAFHFLLGIGTPQTFPPPLSAEEEQAAFAAKKNGEDGKILKQVPGKPVYTATLVKYAELMCENPSGQGMLAGITEA